MLSFDEFVSKCQDRGWTHGGGGAGSSKKAHSSYTFLTGAASMTDVYGNKRAGHTGSLYVPLNDNTDFLRLCADALKNGTELSLHQSIDVPGAAGMQKAVTPLFFDIDWKPFAGSGGMTSAIITQIVRLVTDSGLHKDAAWCARMAPPPKMRERFPALSSGADKVIAQLEVNAHTESPVYAGCTLAQLFESDTASQNWLAHVVATALGIVCQRVVRRYFCELPPTANVFTCFVFASHSASSHASPAQCKLGAHLHLPLPVTPSMAMDMSEGLRRELESVCGLADVVDANVHASGLRMPFTRKPLRPATNLVTTATTATPVTPTTTVPKGRKRTVKLMIDGGGNVVLAPQWYAPVEVVSHTTSLPDVTGDLAHTFRTDILTALMAASVRTHATSPRAGFDSTGLPTCPLHKHVAAGEAGAARLESLGVSKAKMRELQQAAQQTRDPDKFLSDWATYIENVMPPSTDTAASTTVGTAAKRSRTQRYVPLPPGCRELAELQAKLPAIIVLLFGPEFSGLEIVAAGLHPAGMARAGSSTKEPALCAVTTAHMCYNRIDPALAGSTSQQVSQASQTLQQMSQHQHRTGHSRDCAWFMCTASGITQCCSNRAVPGSGSHLRFSNSACSAWPGHQVTLAAYTAGAHMDRQAEAQQICKAYSSLFAAAIAIVSPPPSAPPASPASSVHQ